MRASEIAALQVGDVGCELARPHLRIRRGASKGGRSRIVPLWWDGGTLRDLAAWKAQRIAAGAKPDDPVGGSLWPSRLQTPPCPAAGHANVSITSAYLHVAVEDEGVGELFRT